jgi:thiol:disulfide interchange protein DsbD
VRDPSQTAGFRAARDALPEPYPGSAVYQAGEGVLAVKLGGTALRDPVRFFPYSETLIRNEAEQSIGRDGEATTIGVPMGSGDASGIVSGVVTAGDEAYEIEAEPGAVEPPAGIAGGDPSGDGAAGSGAGSGTGPGTGAVLEAPGLLQAMVLAFLGGILLNLMPCVFPVLSLKALAVVKASGLTLREKRVEGLLYAAGIIVSFLVLAGALLAFRAGGAAVGWGFQLQSPEFVALLAVVLFAVGLSLSGYFELAGSFTGLGQGLVDRGGAAGAFATGVLATIVATPCTAPFMATALGAALLLPPTGALLVFFALGLGLAFPMLLISEVPAVGRLLPKPGPWMNRFRQFLAFPIYATVIWLAVVLGQQAGIHAVAMLLAVLLLVVFAIWAWTLGGGARAAGKALGRGLALVALGISAWLVVSTGGMEPAARPADGGPIAAEPFDPATLAAYRGEGAPVFVNFTAAWCITCLANERVALSTDAVADRFRDGDVRYLKGDWTRRDPVITETLAAYGRSGVPLYLYFAPGSDDAVVLPQLLTPEIVIEAMDEADRGRTSG